MPCQNNSGYLTYLKIYDGYDIICVGNGSNIKLRFHSFIGNTNKPGLKSKKVLLVPKITMNLLSVHKIENDNSYTLEFDDLTLL